MNSVYKNESCKTPRVGFEVCKEKGGGFLESVYQECLAIELGERKISFAAKPELALTCKAHRFNGKFIPNLACHGKIVVELKAGTGLTNEPRAQVQNYLSASGMKLGLLVNFGHYPKPENERIVL